MHTEKQKDNAGSATCYMLELRQETSAIWASAFTFVK